MHIVSSVEGKPFAGKTPYDLTCRDVHEHGGCAQRSRRSLFAQGHQSGAPRIRAMKIIAELEDTTRGP